MAADNTPWTVRRLLDWTQRFFKQNNVEEPKLSAEILLAHALGCRRVDLYLRLDKLPEDPQRDTYRDLVRRRSKHEPPAYLTGSAPFLGFDFEVTRDVLIPRPETEMLVELVQASAKPYRDKPLEPEPSASAEPKPDQSAVREGEAPAEPQTPVPPTPAVHPFVLDLCTGSGCVGVSIAKLLPQVRVIATDISPAAAAVATRNAVKLGVADRVQVLCGDLFAALPSDAPKFDYLVANPPYIADAEIPKLEPVVRDFEPHLALAGGPDGLNLVRRIIAGSSDHLAAGARLFIEIGFDQGPAAEALLRSHGEFTDISVRKDFQGHPRVLTGRYRE